MKSLKISILLSLLFLVAACTAQEESVSVEPTTAPPTVNLKISGSGSVAPILGSIATEFEADNPEYRLEILPGSGTGGGVKGIIEGALDVASMSRSPKSDEAEQGIDFVKFGNSVTAIMTHPEVSITELTKEQFKDIMMGEITNWSEVGGADLDIIVYVRDPEEGNTIDIRELFIDDTNFAESVQVLDSQTDMQNTLASVEGAIGYGTWATALANNATVTTITIDGISVDNMPVEQLTTMGIGYLTTRVDDIQPLIDWLISEKGQTVLGTIGVIPIESE